MTTHPRCRGPAHLVRGQGRARAGPVPPPGQGVQPPGLVDQVQRHPPDWFENYLGLESASATIRTFEIQFVHGLFQTGDYARAVTRLGHQAAPAPEIERRVGLRVKRQDLLTRANPPRIWSIMDEAVLRRPVGGGAVMRAQLCHLTEVAKLPNVTLQAVPFARAATRRQRDVLRAALRRAVPARRGLLRAAHRAVYLEQRSDVEHYLEVMDQLSGEALTPADTIRFIEQIAKET